MESIKHKRVLDLASEVNEARDRKLPQLLLQVEDILLSAVSGSKESRDLKKQIWDCGLLQVLILVLKQDYSIVDGGWSTAAKLASVLSQACSGLDVPDNENYKGCQLPEALDNMFILARRVQARFVQVKKDTPSSFSHGELLLDFRDVLDAQTHLFTAHIFLTSKVLQSPWLLQLLISDDTDTVVSTLALIQNVFRVNSIAFTQVPEQTMVSIVDELIYKLTVNTDPAVGLVAIKCVLRLCDLHKPLIDFMASRYKGLKPLLNKWTGKGFEKQLQELVRLLQAGSSQRAEKEKLERAAVAIQASWKGFHTRKKLKKANKAMTVFQRSFKDRQARLQTEYEDEQHQQELQRKLLMHRQRIMREFHERQLHTIEILPADKIDAFLEKERVVAAAKIQRTWRGHHVRSQISIKHDATKQYKAAVMIQRTVRRWLERLERKKKAILKHQRPPGLTDERRVELQASIVERRENYPPATRSREQQQELHTKAQQMLARYYMTVKKTRQTHEHRDALLARLETDSELLMYSPALKDVTEGDVEMFSSRSVPVASRAKIAHQQELRLLRQPWWKKLVDEHQDQPWEEEYDHMLQF